MTSQMPANVELDEEKTGGNITIRKPSKQSKVNMVGSPMKGLDKERGSILIDTILSQDQQNKVDDLLGRIDKRAAVTTNTVKELQVSLEYSQQEIDTLKAENQVLKRRMASMELKERRTEYQMKKVVHKIDRVDTAGKNRNLIVEGVPEADGGREDVDKTLWTLLDQLKLDKGINIDTCYRVGPFNKNRTRPINVTFLRQADRDLVYSRRTEFRHTKAHKQVWVNEDLGQISKENREHD